MWRVGISMGCLGQPYILTLIMGLLTLWNTHLLHISSDTYPFLVSQQAGICTTPPRGIKRRFDGKIKVNLVFYRYKNQQYGTISYSGHSLTNSIGMTGIFCLQDQHMCQFICLVSTPQFHGIHFTISGKVIGLTIVVPTRTKFYPIPHKYSLTLILY